MNRLARWTMRLYPARWRERYGDELDALITDAGADTRTVADLARGGIRMQFSTWSFPKLALVLGIAGVLLGVAASFLSQPIYESKATLAMQGTPAQLHELIGWVEPEILSRAELSSIINDPRVLLYTHEMKVTPLDDVIELMRSNTRITVGQGQTINISFRYPDAMKAQQTVASLADKFRRAADHGRDAASSDPHRRTIDVVDTASLPFRPFFPDPRLVELICALLGASIPFLWRRLRGKKLLSWGVTACVIVCGLLGSFTGTLLTMSGNPDGPIRPQIRPNPIGNEYRSTAMMVAYDATPGDIQKLIAYTLSRASLATVIQDPRLVLYSDRLAKEPLDDVIQEMRRHLALTPIPGHPNHIAITFEYGGRFSAQQTVEALMSQMNDFWKQNNAATTSTRPGNWGLLSIQSPPSPPLAIATDRFQYAGTGGLIGVILAALIAAVRRRWIPESALSS